MTYPPFYTWWYVLHEPNIPPTGRRKNKGALTELRRAQNLREVVRCPAYHNLLSRCEGHTDEASLALAAGVLAHVKGRPSVGQGTPPSFATQLGTSSEQDKPLLSGLRFRRLISHEEREDVFRTVVRALSFVDHIAEVEPLARDLYDWTSPVRDIPAKWARDYYRAAPLSL